MIHVIIDKGEDEIRYSVDNGDAEICCGYYGYDIDSNGVVTIKYGCDEDNPSRLVFPFVNCLIDIVESEDSE
jgi:hypothetical protein